MAIKPREKADRSFVVYPSLKVVEIHDSHGTRETSVPASLQEDELFGGRVYLLLLSPLFEEDITK